MATGKSNAVRERGPQPLSAEQVCERIRSAILSGELKPGPSSPVLNSYPFLSPSAKVKFLL